MKNVIKSYTKFLKLEWDSWHSQREGFGRGGPDPCLAIIFKKHFINVCKVNASVQKVVYIESARCSFIVIFFALLYLVPFFISFYSLYTLFFSNHLLQDCSKHSSAIHSNLKNCDVFRKKIKCKVNLYNIS